MSQPLVLCIFHFLTSTPNPQAVDFRMFIPLGFYLVALISLRHPEACPH